MFVLFVFGLLTCSEQFSVPCSIYVIWMKFYGMFLISLLIDLYWFLRHGPKYHDFWNSAFSWRIQLFEQHTAKQLTAQICLTQVCSVLLSATEQCNWTWKQIKSKCLQAFVFLEVLYRRALCVPAGHRDEFSIIWVTWLRDEIVKICWRSHQDLEQCLLYSRSTLDVASKSRWEKWWWISHPHRHLEL